MGSRIRESPPRPTASSANALRTYPACSPSSPPRPAEAACLRVLGECRWPRATDAVGGSCLSPIWVASCCADGGGCSVDGAAAEAPWPSEGHRPPMPSPLVKSRFPGPGCCLCAPYGLLGVMLRINWHSRMPRRRPHGLWWRSPQDSPPSRLTLRGSTVPNPCFTSSA